MEILEVGAPVAAWQRHLDQMRAEDNARLAEVQELSKALAPAPEPVVEPAPEERALTDTEMLALAAVAHLDIAIVNAANADRAARGMGMAFEWCDSAAGERLRKEMQRRGLIPAE